MPSLGATPILALAGWAAGIHILKNALLAAMTWWRAHVAAFDAAALSTRLLRVYLAAPWTFHLRRSSATLIERLHDGARHYFDALQAGAIMSSWRWASSRSSSRR